MRVLLEPKQLDVTLTNGTQKTFILSKFPALAGREIVHKYPTSLIPKVGDYATNEETCLKMMCFVAALDTNTGKEIQLNTRALVDNHVYDWETLLKLELSIMEYNCSFFRDGRISNFFRDIVQKLPQFLSKMLTNLSASSSPTIKPNSTN